MMESAVSPGVAAPMSSPHGPATRSSSSSSTAGLEQTLAAAGLVAARSERADVEGIGLEHSLIAGTSNLSSCVRTTTAVSLPRLNLRRARPRARQRSGRRRSGSGPSSRTCPARRRRSCASRAALPAAELLGGVDGPEDEQPRRRSEHVGEHLAPLVLDEMAPAPAKRVAFFGGECARAFALSLHDREQDAAFVPGEQVADLADYSRVGLLDEDVDLTPAGESDRRAPCRR